MGEVGAYIIWALRKGSLTEMGRGGVISNNTKYNFLKERQISHVIYTLTQ